MSRSTRVAARPLDAARPPGLSRRSAFLLILLLGAGLGAGMAGTAVADPPPTVQRVAAAEAAAAGGAVAISRRPMRGATVVEVRLPVGSPLSLLAVAPDGQRAALAVSGNTGDGWLVIAQADGSQVRVALGGVGGAGFDATGQALAAVDRAGHLWLVDPASGSARRVADGPFAGAPEFAADGSIMALAVDAVEAPMSSRAVAVDPTTGMVRPLSGDQMVYAATPLADGSVALLVHLPAGNQLRRADGGASVPLADLGPGVVRAAVAATGSPVAFERGGEVFLVGAKGGARRVASGTAPQLSADGRWLLVRRDGGTDLVDLAMGQVTATFDADAAFVACGEECQP